MAQSPLLDDAPRDAAHALAFDGDHRLGQVSRDLLLLFGAEDVLDEPDADKGHGSLLGSG